MIYSVPAQMDALTRQLQLDLVRYAGFGDKVSGGVGDHAAADWIAQRLAALGYEVQRQPIEVPVFEAGVCTLEAGVAIAEVWPQPPVTWTDPIDITAPLAVVRAGFDAPDARGCIALLVLPHGRHASMQSPLILPLMKEAEAAGALALVVVPTGPTGQVVALNCELDAPVSQLPTAVLAPAQAEPFLAAARDAVPATLRLAGRSSRGTTANVLGTLRRGPRWIALSTPRTGWFCCASERGTGTAAFLALAAWAAQRENRHSVFLLNSGAHEYQFAGAKRAMPVAPPAAATAVWAHLGAALATRDRLEFRGREQSLPSADPNRTVMASPTMLDAVSTAFAGLSGLERPMGVLEGVSELGTIASHGYRRCFAVLGIPKMFHTRQDTLEAVDAALLAPVVQAHIAAIEAVLESDLRETKAAAV